MDANQPHIVRMMGNLGGVTRSSVPIEARDKKWRAHDEEGKADLIGILNGHGLAIECKVHDSGFTLAEGVWTPRQRAYMEWFEQQCGGIYWLAWQTGTERVNSRNVEDRVCQWLMPGRVMLKLCKKYGFVPHKIGVSHPIEMKKENYTCYTAASAFALQWVDGAWTVPATHPFYAVYLAHQNTAAREALNNALNRAGARPF